MDVDNVGDFDGTCSHNLDDLSRHLLHFATQPAFLGVALAVGVGGHIIGNRKVVRGVLVDRVVLIETPLLRFGLRLSIRLVGVVVVAGALFLEGIHGFFILHGLVEDRVASVGT